uniref:Ovule protein n=1 Tax=Heterorhabditis bacteriophora TaxID=37862 RepID=A0A1I7WND8_HETBA
MHILSNNLLDLSLENVLFTIKFSMFTVLMSCYLDYSPVGPRYSNLVLQALLVLLNEPPPPQLR